MYINFEYVQTHVLRRINKNLATLWRVLLLVFRFHPHVVEHEREDVHRFLDGLVEGFAATVTRVALDADEVRLAADVAVLQGGGILEGVRGHHPVVVVGGGH